jgi:hypothetical protein
LLTEGKHFRDTANVDEPLHVVVLDEAHRIRTISTSRFTPAKARTGKAQIDGILDASRVSVGLIERIERAYAIVDIRGVN